MQTLADYFGTSEEPATPGAVRLEDITDSKAFALAILDSKEFRQYIINGLTLGELPSAIVCRLMDYGWGKPAERIEHTGKDGEPIVTEVRRIIIHAAADFSEQVADDKPVVMH